MSVKRLPSCIPIPLDEKELKELVSKTKDWVVMHGIGIRSKTAFSEDSINFAPYLLLPSTFPRKEFERAVEIQTTLNELMHRVAHNQEFLKETLKDTIQVDEFTGSLYKIWETVLNEGVTQKLSLGLVRSDYMLHSDTNKIKQVEYNTISVSMAGVGNGISLYNRFVLEELEHFDKLQNLPENNALTGMTMGLLEAWKIYGDSKAAILVIVEDVTYNICDQRFHEFELKRLNPRVKLMRKTLTDVHMEGSLSENNELMIGNTVVSVVYYRSAYTPEQIPTKKEWGSRLLIERSQAIKCPSIQYHLAGTKKVQQALAKPGALEPFLSDPNKIAAVRDIFTGLFGLDFDEAGDQAIQMALDDPERFVLKPQREGGGNNIYGSEIRDAIMQMKDTKERTAWILMERINPPISTGYMIRPGGQNPPQLAEMISELGIFGVVIGDSQKIMVNRQVGHMLRTKVSTADEGGVAAGYGALDSPYLIDID
ncbi:glutathione synthetase isoform X1 [Dendroctonus ponderosae]|uniref:Glutathione synthetase n=2 Tax=Dendroctonus ponderosae TaxID=77166 RepID=A0AAR5Q7U1_DENPD|nr:glutathione synthetase isoform X1 [Dendroctonus ponderosae]XP_019769299.1 glutathione synthetase isoform X1 [Dendroctonus ponderosae]XP_019769300.1 glutathione synthetase isoform X1 [Dendroctonus ponderosae]